MAPDLEELLPCAVFSDSLKMLFSLRQSPFPEPKAVQTVASVK
jgi:hypothetical protein